MNMAIFKKLPKEEILIAVIMRLGLKVDHYNELESYMLVQLK